MWYIISKQTYTIRKYHRVFSNNGIYTFKCHTWYPINITDTRSDWRIDGEDDEIIKISEKQLCGICFSRPRIPKVAVNARDGRI